MPIAHRVSQQRLRDKGWIFKKKQQQIYRITNHMFAILVNIVEF